MKIKIEQRSNSLVFDWDSDFPSELIELKTFDDQIYKGKARRTVSIGDKVSASQFIYVYVIQGDLTLYVTKFYYRSENDPVQIHTDRESGYFYTKLANSQNNKAYLNNMKAEIKGLIGGVINVR